MSQRDLDAVRSAITARGLSIDAPAINAPWIFRAPPEEMFAVSYALATSFVASGRVDVAYLYQLQYPRTGAPTQLVLALDEPDTAQAATMVEVATRAGAPAATFVVRFLPDEPSHRAGIEGFRLDPFYRRPCVT